MFLSSDGNVKVDGIGNVKVVFEIGSVRVCVRGVKVFVVYGLGTRQSGVFGLSGFVVVE